MASEKSYPERETGEIVRLGFAGRCPRCGEGRIFASYLKVADECTACGLSFREHDAGDAAVVPAMLILGTVLVGVGLYVEFTFEPPLWLFAVVLGVLTVGMTMAILPRLKGVTVALQHKYRSTETPTRPGGA